MDTPRYEYSRSVLNERIVYLKGLSAPYGLTVRYAMKANPHPDILAMMSNADIAFDASSSYEVAELLQQGVQGNNISLSSQQSPHNLDELLENNVHFVATSFNQLKMFLEHSKHTKTVGVRINPGSGGLGHTKRTSTGGVSASFGIWHEYSEEILRHTRQAGVSVDRVHIHVGSGANPSVWGGVMDNALAIMERFTDATTLDIGGGFKVHRFHGEQEADMHDIIEVFSNKLESFYERTGRRLHLEIEPGTFFIAHAGTLVARVDDIVDTGSEGYTFLRLNTGMNDFLRSTMYGARHEIEVVNNAATEKQYVVVGHNCESGDIFTPAPGSPEEIEPRTLKEAAIGDEVRIHDMGAYCASMRAKGYNSFPDAVEVMVD